MATESMQARLYQELEEREARPVQGGPRFHHQVVATTGQVRLQGGPEG